DTCHRTAAAGVGNSVMPRAVAGAGQVARTRGQTDHPTVTDRRAVDGDARPGVQRHGASLSLQATNSRTRLLGDLLQNGARQRQLVTYHSQAIAEADDTVAAAQRSDRRLGSHTHELRAVVVVRRISILVEVNLTGDRRIRRRRGLEHQSIANLKPTVDSQLSGFANL